MGRFSSKTFSSKKQPPVIATCKAPMYCIKKLGGRHILLGGGGGAAKTGVKNQIEQHVLTFAEEAVNNCYMRAKLTNTIDTDKFSTMNMDIVSIPGKTGHVLAAGHDEYCDIYETTNNFAEEGSFGINLRPVGRLLTVLAEKSSAANSEPAYQKCVRFDKSSHGKKLLTGDSDGYIRVWNIDHLRNDRNPELKRGPTLEFYAHPHGTNDRIEKGGVDDIDISSDGRYFFSVGGDNKVILWDLTVGKKVQELPFPPELETRYRVRSLKFTRLGLEGNNHIFVVAYNEKQRNSKSRCFLGLWAFHRERHTLQPIVIKSCYQGESISCLTVSPCGNFTGFGTLSGSVAIFDTHELKPLLFVKETHGIFVTDVEFLDRVVDDCQMTDANNKQIEIPGPAADCRACLVSLSADQTVQVHRLAFEQPPSSTLFLVKLMIFLNIIYYLIWTLAGY